MRNEMSMDCPSSLDDLATPIVADASVVINIIASRFAPTILGALPEPLRVPSEAQAELERGRSRGHEHADKLAGLVDAGRVAIVDLGAAGVHCFSSLVVGPAGDTLDDGEAATIAYAVEHDATTLIDEKKATRLCAERFNRLTVGSTVDLIGCQAVRTKLDQDLADAIFNMLLGARMRVPPQYLDWVVAQIGLERAAQCPALPARYRNVGDA